MAIKINTAYGERLTSKMLNDKVHNIVGANGKLNGFNVKLASPTSVTITPGKAIVNGCAIEETSETKTVALEQEILSSDGLVYVVLNYAHEAGSVIFTCSTTVTSTMVKLATLSINGGVITEVNNHTNIRSLSTVVSEAAEIEAQKVRDTIPSGFIELGELDYDYMLNNENVVKLKTKSVAYVNGYRVEIPADTIINIGKAPEKELREDLLFLEVWKDEDFNRDGQVKWRIRHVADVDFATHPEGLRNTGSQWQPFQCFGQGGRSNPLTSNLGAGARYSFCQAGNARDLADHYGSFPNLDTGLYVCGAKDSTAKINLETLDGYSYAVPMFKLYRKPSCGKAIPFEYQRINPKVDYSKFTTLTKEDSVEKVINENIKGQSLTNLLPVTSYTGAINKGVCWNIPLKTNTDYTLIACGDINAGTTIQSPFIIVSNAFISSPSTQANTGDNLYINTVQSGKGKELIQLGDLVSTKRVVFNSGNYIYAHCRSGNSNTTAFSYSNIMLLEGDWTNKEIPEFFTGLKSLGEDENLVTVKNGILDESSYDPGSGSVKLHSAVGDNHIRCENSILPGIEAQIKRNNIKVSDVFSFQKISDLSGDEIIDFVKIKGKTLQNVIKYNNKVCNAGGTITVPFTCRLKAKSWYTVIVNVKENTLDGSIRISGYNFAGGHGLVYNPESSFNSDKNIFSAKQTGVWIGKVMINNFGTYTPVFSMFTEAATTGSYTADIMVLDGDYTNDLSIYRMPYFENIKSVSEEENNKISLIRRGKNLFDPKSNSNYYTTNGLTFSLIDNDIYVDGTATGIVDFRVFTEAINSGLYSFVNNSEEGTTFQLSNNLGLDSYFSYKYNNSFQYPKNTITTAKLKTGITAFIRFPQGASFKNQRFLVQLECSQEITPFEPFIKTYVQEITLKEPLRSLPSGVCDTIEGNKVIRRVGKITFNGTETWALNSGWDTDTICHFWTVFGSGIPVKEYSSICDKFSHVVGELPTITENYRFGQRQVDNSYLLYLNVSKAKLSSNDVSGFKTWLSQNPTTVYYELATPIEEIIEPNYDKESVKTYQLDEPLRSLPNGVKDEIVDGKLIRRCGEIVFDGSDDEEWALDESNARDTTQLFPVTLKSVKVSNNSNSGAMCDKLSSYSTENLIYKDNIGVATRRTNSGILIRHTSQNVESLKSWLKSNPIKVIYELATPIEIQLKEVHASTANFSLQRQFSEGNWLRELPNGVKDTIENGKVTRRVKKLVLNGSESGVGLGNEVNNSLSYVIENVGLKNNGDDVLNVWATVPTFERNNLNVNDFGICSPQKTGSFTNGLTLIIEKSKLNTPNLTGIKTWLASNPITVMFELATPTTEELSGNNNRYVPYHEDNTYCGSLYVGNGTNDVFVENGLSNDGVVIDTPFRSIENKAVVDDCRYKKNVDGYDNMYVTSATKNLANFKNFKYFGSTESYVINNGVKILATQNKTWAGGKIELGRLKPNTKYSLKYDVNKIDYVNGYNPAIHIKRDDNVMVSTINNFTTPNIYCDTYYLAVYGTYDKAGTCNVDFTNIQLEENGESTSFEDYISTEKAFENTESNDVDDLRHKVSLTGFNYDQILNESFDKLLRGEL